MRKSGDRWAILASVCARGTRMFWATLPLSVRPKWAGCLPPILAKEWHRFEAPRPGLSKDLVESTSQSVRAPGVVRQAATGLFKEVRLDCARQKAGIYKAIRAIPEKA